MSGTGRQMGTRWTGTFRLYGTLGALLCTACPNPNTYTTPRTVEKGRVSHSIAAEGIGLRTTTSEGSASASFPTFPSYAARIGLADRWELGVRLTNLSSVGADAKYNPVRTEFFDLALDPGAQVFWMSSGSSTSDDGTQAESIFIGYLHAPLLVGFNMGDSVSLVLSPGASVALVSGSFETSEDAQDAAFTRGGFFGRVGAGFDFRLLDNFALHPEVTFLDDFRNDSTVVYVFGLGFNFGALPRFGAEPIATVRQ
jgi:hypothetical protein